ncbi:hypothetical protein PSN45_001792 [Yamadazyma tenuis]|uniref:Nucleolar pre-ribosomal-associated protein 1 C-terminal domain-containing protein n=2 Tax=Candida tenuis (strain ATCC 10573 / BCRC 21748 / CBS 615 / JCM 9827 / NBRC 10315 / NRRL Y-1498 / VKM Y-70) TaxID=590646 RepID=G3BE38_CANTC|nr:uncharacterized protein CANTEDRAFT_136931 [Yamadazyma tenuis ATCC 10573]EGV60450.1 hypothetical protein CANTEDRAFT_136931 [Yamadazyma tenuis ATCC 10573]WEJ94308.1 hypothetical protein PSN45_001792 [Yamadazyma tenuis]
MSVSVFEPSILLNTETFVKFTESGDLKKLLGQWYHACKTNSHSQVVTFLGYLRSITNKISSESIHNDQIKQFYLEFVDPTNIKMVYRCLNQKKNSITIPTLSILQDMVSYRLVNDLLNGFDISTNILPGLLLKEDSIRSNFIRFWLHLNTHMNYFDRMNYLGLKVWINIFKYMANDPPEIVALLVQFLEAKILNEPAFRRSTKLKLFNETCLFNLQANMDKFKLFPLFKKIVDPKTGILFLDAPNTTATVNNKTFRINNKVLYNLLTFVKLDSISKVNLVHLILSKDYKLIDPYMNRLLINGGYHDPNLTSWYLSHTLLYTKILQLPTYDLQNVLLKPLSKASLTKGIKSKSNLIIQLNLQIIYLMLKKLDHIEDQLVINSVFKNLPELSDLIISSNVQTVNLMVLKILEIYSKYQNSLNTSLNKYVSTILSEATENFTKLNLIKLNFIISIQLNLSNKFDLKQNSLILKLVKFSIIDKNASFFHDMINKLVEIPKVTLLNPMYSLLYSQVPEELLPSLNESLTRLNNPYSYYDLPIETNVFVKILVEQFSIYFKKNNNSGLEWFEKFLTNLCIIGEDFNQLKMLLDHFGIKCNPTLQNIEDPSIIKNDFELLSVIYNIKLSTSENYIVDAFGRLQNYTVSNSEFVSNFSNLSFFKLLAFEDDFKLQCFNQLIKPLEIDFNSEIKSYVFEKLKSTSSFSALSWILNEEQLNYQGFNEDIQLVNFELLISRNQKPNIEIEKLFRFNNDKKYDIIKFLLTPDNVSKHIGKIIVSGKLELLNEIELDCSSIQYLNQLDLSNIELCKIGAALLPTESLADFYKNINVSETGLSFYQFLQLVWKSLPFRSFDSDIVVSLLQKASNYSDTFCPAFVNVLNELKVHNKEWLSNSMIYITKQFAERDELSDEFYDFLEQYIKLLPVSVPVNVINSQLEVLLSSKYINSKFLSYMNSVILSEPRIDFDKMLTLFMNNPNNCLNEFSHPSKQFTRIESSLVVYNLFNLGASHSVLNNLIYWYNGSIAFEDLIIKKILVKMESVQQKSWMTDRWNWEINDFKESDFDLVGKQPLFSNDLISLNKNFISNCSKNYQPLDVPSQYKEIVDFVNKNYFKVNYEYSETVYDYEFLLLLTINNEEFFKSQDETLQVNMKNLIEYSILEILVKNFNSPLCKVIVGNIIKNIDNDKGFKDITLFKIYLSNLFNCSQLTGVQLTLYANLIPILSNPGHFLYELVFKYVTSHPRIGPKDMPLFFKIKSESLKTIEWYISGMTITTDDLQLLNTNQFFEWILTLLNTPGKVESLHKTILKTIFMLPDINYGSLSLITRNGILSYLEQISSGHTNLKLNLQEIAQKLEISASKRTLEWSNYDLVNVSKRLKL